MENQLWLKYKMRVTVAPELGYALVSEKEL